METSAKESYNVSELFTMIARKLPIEQPSNIQRASRGASNTQQGGRGGVDLGQGQSGQDGDACNC